MIESLSAQHVIRQALKSEMRAPGYASLIQLPMIGPIVHRRSLMRGQAALAIEGRSLLTAKGWRAQAWELRYPASVWLKHIDPAAWTAVQAGMETTFHATVVNNDGWTPAAAPSHLLPTIEGVSDLDVLEWLGFAGGLHSHGDHEDPHWTPISYKERVSDVADIFEDELDDAWRSEDATRYANTVTWWKGKIGFAWNAVMSSIISILISEGTSDSQRSLVGNDAKEWTLENIEAWAEEGIRSFFDNHPSSELQSKLSDRYIVNVKTDDHTIGEMVGVQLIQTEWDRMLRYYPVAAAYDEDDEGYPE